MAEGRDPRPLSGRLLLRGGREHNLQGVDLDLLHGEWTSVVGPSGSGKTSLVQDTLVREGERRFLGSLSPRARQFLGKLGRARADRITGLPVPLAIGSRELVGSPRSTVGTRSGVLDLLRLAFAREAAHPGTELCRSHFSFNTSEGACPSCSGLGEEDRVDPALLVKDASRSIREGALVPTLKSGYTVYSQVTAEVMQTICEAHGFDMDTPWGELDEEQQGVILYGTRRLEVPFGKHSLESRMRWEGITARPRETGYYRGLVPVIEETLARGRNPNILRFVRSSPCSVCGGTRLAAPGREATLPDGSTLPELVGATPTELLARLGALGGLASFAALEHELAARAGRMQRLALDHLTFSRGTASLSGGEARRLDLAAQLASGIGGLLVALDEPTLGLHPESQAGMRDVLDELLGAGNTLLVVEHDPDMVGWADRVLALGPGAGPEGGRVVLDTREAAGSLGGPPTSTSRRRSGKGTLALRGARLHNLQGADLLVPAGTLHVVLGPSGAGKSSLVFGTLLPALAGEPGGPHAGLELPEGLIGQRAIDARAMGRSSRSTPATWSGVFEAIRRRFAETPAARERGLGAAAFSFNSKGGGRCPTCEGLGVVRTGLHLVEDSTETCGSCGGSRYAPEVLAVRDGGLDIAGVLRLTATEAAEHFRGDERIAPTLEAMVELGIGHLALGAPSTEISTGEAQRIRLATLVASPPAAPTLFAFDEPDRGLHPDDVERLLGVLQRLVDHGHTLLAISHHRTIWAAADGLTEVREGRARPVDFEQVAMLELPPRPARPAAPSRVELRGVRTHNLAGLDLDLPHGSWIGVAGVSGSGKSSLAFETVAAEAWRRFAESLPFQVRRFVRRAARPEFDSIEGLLPVVSLRQRPPEPDDRSTVATQSELGPLLRLLFSRAGQLEGRPCGLSAGHFSPDRALGACPDCGGRGGVQRCDPGLLVSNPERGLLDGALGGTKAGAFLSEPDGQYMATLRIAAGHDLEQPWQDLPEEVRRIALEGTGEQEYEVTWRFRRGKREGEHQFRGPWEGLLELATREATRRGRTKTGRPWMEVLREQPCPGCGGGGLRREVAQVRVGQLSIQEAMELPLGELGERLEVEVGEHAAGRALLPELVERLRDLARLGVGDLPLGRSARELRASELQRVRLAGVLRAGLVGTLVVLDEPDAGLQAEELRPVVQRLQELRDAGNTLLVVSHREELLAAADELVVLGPGAGPDGGQLLGQGPPASLLGREDLRSLVDFTMGDEAGTAIQPAAGAGPRLLALGHELPPSGLVILDSVSNPELAQLVRELAEHFDEVVRVEGRSRARSVLTALDGMKAFQALFHGAQKELGSREEVEELPRSAFSFLSPRGRCPDCKGSGSETVALDVVADLELPCSSCGGARFRPEVLEVRWEGMDAATLLATPAMSLPASVGKPLGRLVEVLERLGLGHLALGRDPRGLSGGERQRLALAAGLLSSGGRRLFLLEEPELGLSGRDLRGLVESLRQLGAEGDLVLARVHRPELEEVATAVLRGEAVVG